MLQHFVKFCAELSFPPGVWVGILNLIVSISVLSILTHFGCSCKNLIFVSGMDRQICPEGHILASRGSPSDAKL